MDDRSTLLFGIGISEGFYEEIVKFGIWDPLPIGQKSGFGTLVAVRIRKSRSDARAGNDAASFRVKDLESKVVADVDVDANKVTKDLGGCVGESGGIIFRKMDRFQPLKTQEWTDVGNLAS